MDYGVGDCLAQDLLGNLQRVDTRDALDHRGSPQILGDCRDGIRDHFAQRSLADRTVHEPQRPRRALLRSGIDRHIDKELRIELLRIGTRSQEPGLSNIALGVEEIQALQLRFLVRRAAHCPGCQRESTLYRAVDQGLVKIACDRAGHRIAITGARPLV